jgi:hypothetical protein
MSVTIFSLCVSLSEKLTREKGDEQKPRCANCEVKGFTCKYGSDLAFVPPRSGDAPGGRHVYGTISVSEAEIYSTDTANRIK